MIAIILIIAFVCILGSLLLIGLLVLEYQGELDTNKINLNQLRIQAAELTSILNIRYKYIK